MQHKNKQNLGFSIVKWKTKTKTKQNAKKKTKIFKSNQLGLKHKAQSHVSLSGQIKTTNIYYLIISHIFNNNKLNKQTKY